MRTALWGVLIGLLSLLAGCGGGSSSLLPSDKVAPPEDTGTQSPGEDLANLPQLNELALINRTSSELLLQRNGSEHEPGLAQRVSVEVSSARFNPNWPLPKWHSIGRKWH